ncbi:hypothetical protein FACS1894167_08230 [Synergistales bacterium]|nr:hypothetical protein FACS1894167_08230 [Synergistales bacterium]
MATKTTKIKFNKRVGTGKGTCRKLRVRGVVPVIFYGPEFKESLIGEVSVKELASVANTPNWETSIIDLELPDGRTEMALLRSVQRNVVTQGLLHADLYQLVKGHKVKVAIPIRVINKEISPGVKMGGVLEQPLREIEISVLPREMPTEIVIDASKLALGSEIFIKEIRESSLPESAELLTNEDTVVVMVSRPRSMVETTEEEEPKEVEVVGKGKRKEEEA